MELIQLQMMIFNNHRLIKYGIKLPKSVLVQMCVFSLMTSKISIFLFACMYVCVCAIDFFSLECTRAIIVIYTYKYLFFVFVVNNQHTHTRENKYEFYCILTYVCLKIFFVERLCNK